MLNHITIMGRLTRDPELRTTGTGIVEYEIGYYDGYKWMTEMPIRLIKDVVAWMPFPNMTEPQEGE